MIYAVYLLHQPRDLADSLAWLVAPPGLIQLWPLVGWRSGREARISHSRDLVQFHLLERGPAFIERLDRALGSFLLLLFREKWQRATASSQVLLGYFVNLSVSLSVCLSFLCSIIFCKYFSLPERAEMVVDSSEEAQSQSLVTGKVKKYTEGGASLTWVKRREANVRI